MPDAPDSLEVDLDWRSVLVFLAAFSALVAATGLARSVPRTITAVAIGTLLALALNPVVVLVQRRLRLGRANAVAVVALAAAAVVTSLGLLLVPPAVRQAGALGRELPTVVADLEDLPVVGNALADAGAPRKVENWVRELPDRLSVDASPLRRAAQSVAGGVAAGVLTLLFAFSLLLDGERLLRGARRLLPEARRERADRMALLTYSVVGRYVAGSLLVAGVAGLVVLSAGLVLGVPLSPLAAAWVAVWDLVPQIGGAAGGIPFVLLGLTQGAGTGLACAAIFVVYLQIENHVLGPLLVGQAVKLSPPATMTAALIGVSAGGVVGALLAVPLLGAAKAIYLELRPEPAPLPEPAPA
ncbi:MAG TPA: AI-2E family transporter [Acidimicrobiales bacterium]|nr:AI-2E family transporter [Acidimicrobiales bacterium]